MTAGQEKRGC